jgi:hypothetical protein
MNTPETQSGGSLEPVGSAPEDLAVVMAYEAMRICLGLPTRHHPVGSVLKWMELMALTQNAEDEP